MSECFQRSSYMHCITFNSDFVIFKSADETYAIIQKKKITNVLAPGI